MERQSGDRVEGSGRQSGRESLAKFQKSKTTQRPPERYLQVIPVRKGASLKM